MYQSRTQAAPAHRADPPPRRRGWARVLTGAVATAVALGVSAVVAPSASAALSSVGPIDPATNFPVSYTDGSGLALELCLDGDPACLAGPDLLDVHAAGGDAEAFYYALDAEAGPFSLHDALEAAYNADGPDQEMVFQRTEVRQREVRLPANTKYTVTDPYGTFTCTTDASGEIDSNGCRLETAPVPLEFDRALSGANARLGPFVTWDTFGSTGAGAPPAGYIGDNVTPHKVTGSPTGFNAFRVEGPGLSTTCAGGTIPSCVETDLFVVQGKVHVGGASASVSSGTLDFGDVPGTPPVTKSVTYANTGAVPVAISSIAVSGPGAPAFAVQHDCPATLDAGARCRIDVTFTPAAGTSSAATLTITDDTPVGTRTVALSGSNLGKSVVADPPPPAGLVFPSTTVGTQSAQDNVVIGNTGNGPLTITSATITGAGASHYKLGTNGCTAPVDPDSGCEIGVVFAPTTTGSKSANLRVTDSTGAIVNVTLTGTGVAPPQGDTQLPTAPTLSGSRTGTTANLSWTAATDNVGVTGYQVFRNGTQVAANLPATPRTFVDANLAPGTYSYTVKALDAAGNVSPASTAVSVTVPDVDTQAPTAPTLSGSWTGTSVSLSWTAATDNVGVTGYQVFRNGTQVGANLAASARSFGDTSVVPGTYSYTVKALDAAGNVSPASNAVPITLTDLQPPSATVAPTPFATGVAVAGNVTATFSERVTGVTGTTFTLRGPGGTTVAAAVNYNATTRVATLNPGTDLAAGTTYTATLSGGSTAIRDLATPANPLDTVSWTFTTAGVNPPPTLTARAPAVNATSIGVAANVTATFSEPVTGVGTSTFQLKNPAGTVIAAAVTRNGTTNQWILNPGTNLAADTRYTVTLTGGGSAIRDLAGAPLATTSWSFTTGPAPTVTARTPAVNAINVSRTANVTATFSENVTGNSGTMVVLKNATTGATVTAVVSYSATTRVVTLNPSATLPASARFTVTLTGGATAIRDAAGNPLATTTWSFTTGTV